jgi:hypothetical protein
MRLLVVPAVMAAESVAARGGIRSRLNLREARLRDGAARTNHGFEHTAYVSCDALMQ